VSLKAVLFDVDFTLVRPGPQLGPEGYVRAGRRYGLDLDPAKYDDARERALESLQRDPDLRHDEEIWIAFTERIVRGMGGDAEAARRCAVDIERAWERSENFSLYEDALPVLDELRSHELKIGLVSNGARDLPEFVRHHGLEVDAAVASRAHGKVKPDPTIFEAALSTLEVAAEEAVMVGDSLEDDVEGARALGIKAILVDREGRYADVEDRLTDLYGLPAALGLQPAARRAPPSG
jgi:putative hydrolase of the HAD superfamily